MAKLTRITNTIYGNERAVGLFEIHEQSPNSRGFHRYQIIRVIRDGQIAEFRKDMGLAKKYKGINQIRIPSLLEHTVDELMGMADDMRGKPEIDMKQLLELDTWKPA